MLIDRTDNSPLIELNTTALTFYMDGDSYMENVSGFYERIIHEIRTNLNPNKSEVFKVTINLGFYNTSSMYFINLILVEIGRMFTLELTFNVNQDDYDDFEENISYLVASKKIKYKINKLP